MNEEKFISHQYDGPKVLRPAISNKLNSIASSLKSFWKKAFPKRPDLTIDERRELEFRHSKSRINNQDFLGGRDV